MDLFLDSGLVYGFLDSNDSFHRRITRFFNFYDFDQHRYYTTKRVVQLEIKNIRRKRVWGGNKQEREFQRMLLEFVETITDIDFFNHHLFDRLFKVILEVLELRKKDTNPKEHDADLLTNAYLWDFSDGELDTPQFVTIDGNDISRNREEIKDEVETCLKCQTQLTITLVYR